MKKVCKKCLYDTNHPLGLTINEEGICSGCLIHDEKYNLDSGVTSKEYKDKINLTVNTTSTPEENKLIIFNGLTYHASTTPTTTPRRVAINFNYR